MNEDEVLSKVPLLTCLIKCIHVDSCLDNGREQDEMVKRKPRHPDLDEREKN
jgi:hypothetical protein